MGKLTNKKTTPAKSLTSHLNAPFELSFKYKLKNGYTFSDMKQEHYKEFQHFLDLVSQMSFQDVEKRYKRQSDTTDSFNGAQMIHFEVGKTFRIHGITEAGRFVVLRLDPNHKFHT